MKKTYKIQIPLFITVILWLMNSLMVFADVQNPDNKEMSMVKADIKYDAQNIIKNPGMGWTLYIDSGGGRYELGDNIPDADIYWDSVKDYLTVASVLYLRITWAELEPEKGRYAWLYDQNLKKLIEGAKQRGIKLAFCIFVVSQDCPVQATPDYVRNEGAKGHYMFNLRNGTKAWSPYEYDAVFQKNFAVFLSNFAKTFDNPDIVDYIDGISLGWWGETHWMNYSGDKELDSNGLYTYQQKVQMYNWALSTYTSCFKKVILVDNASDYGFGWEFRDKAISNNYNLRRASLGSPWFWPHEKDYVSRHFPQQAFFGENCFHHFKEEWWRNIDASLKNKNLSEIMELVVNDALEYHANTLDLRIPADAALWFNTRYDLVKKFAIQGGYRLFPDDVYYTPDADSRGNFIINYKMKNSGVGKIPNNFSNWNSKYGVAFALIEKNTNKVASLILDTSLELGTVTASSPISSEVKLKAEGLSPAAYKLGIAIVDKTKGNVPAIKLALLNSKTEEGWYIIGETEIKKTSGYTSIPAKNQSQNSQAVSSINARSNISSQDTYPSYFASSTISSTTKSGTGPGKGNGILYLFIIILSAVAISVIGVLMNLLIRKK